MRIGAIFPTKEIGSDPGAVREWTQGVEEMGFTHALVYDHVLGANTARRPDWQGPYDMHDPFHEPFTLLAFMAAVSERLELVTGVVILPQRQTALVAKQAAEVDVLSRGRLRLGVGLGWNEVEYEALGKDFSNRGARVEEQIELMRRLWTEPAVEHSGRWESVPDAGINPLPVNRPIPVWMGGGFAPRALRRIGRLADGWIPLHPPNERGREALETIRAAAREAGREEAEIGIEGRLPLDLEREDRWAEMTEAWRAFGATHLGAYTMDQGLQGPEQHLERLRRCRETVGT